MDFYKQTKKELMKNNELLQFLYTWVVDLGVPETQANSTNIIRKLTKVRQQILTIEAKSAALGYTSVEVALKALGQMKSDKYVDASNLPEVLQNLPYIWVNGRAPSPKRGLDGLVPLGVKQAKRKYNQILPLLVEAWNLAADEPEIREQIVYNYQTESCAQFEADLFTYIHCLEPLSFEEEVEDGGVSLDAMDDDTQAIFTLMKTSAEKAGNCVSERLLMARAITASSKVNRGRVK
jgi:hypothetical protein